MYPLNATLAHLSDLIVLSKSPPTVFSPLNLIGFLLDVTTLSRPLRFALDFLTVAMVSSSSPMSHVLTGDEYLALPRAPETWLIEPLVPAGGAITLYGDAKVGKSYAALQLADAIRQGIPWMGFPTRQSGPVVYVQLDTPRSLWGARVQALLESGLPVSELHFADRETLGTWPFDILNPDHANLLRASLTPINPVAVVIDTLREAHSGDENDSTAMQKVIAELVAATQPAALITVSHSRKSQPDGHADLISDQRGSNYVVGRMDAIIRFTKKSIHFTGRAIEEGSLRCQRLDNGLWSPETAEIDAHIVDILAKPGSMREHARLLATKLNRSEEACRSLIRRFLAGGSGVVTQGEDGLNP